MKVLNYLKLIAILFVASSCATAHYYEQTAENVDFAKYKTYAFLPQSDTAEFSVYNSGIVQEKTVEYIKKEMDSRGFELNAEKPDLLILPHFMFKRKNTTVYDPAYSDYDYWYPGFYVSPWFAYYYPGYTDIPDIDGNGLRLIEYTEGTIVIDVIENNDSHRLLWRGWSEDAINPNTFTRDIGYYIHRIFQKFPVKQMK